GPAAGTVKTLEVKEGDKVSEGDLILILERSGGSEQRPAPSAAAEPRTETAQLSQQEQVEHVPRAQYEQQAGERPDVAPATAGSQLAAVDEAGFAATHASPSVRRIARQLGVDLSRVEGSGRKGRVLQSDVEQFVSGVMRGDTAPTTPAPGDGLPRMPEIDFSQ